MSKNDFVKFGGKYFFNDDLARIANRLYRFHLPNPIQNPMTLSILKERLLYFYN